MDSYKTAAAYSDADSYYVNFNYEVLQGCKHRCDGCSVNRKIQESFSDREANKFSALLMQFRREGLKPFIAFIGPTDFLSADNTAEFLDSGHVWSMLMSYRRVSFVTTCLDISEADRIADILNDKYADLELEINVALEPAKLKDKEYIDLVKSNFEELKKKLHKFDIRSFAVFNVFNYEKKGLSEAIGGYQEMSDLIGDYFDTTIDFNFSLGRRNYVNPSEFKERCFDIADLFDEAVCNNNKVRFSFGKLDDALVERQYNYRNGKFYYSPMLYERYVGFNNELEIPVEKWEPEAFEEFEDHVAEQGYITINEKEECAECPYSAMCIERGIHYLMDIYDVKECLVAKKALDAING